MAPGEGGVGDLSCLHWEVVAMWLVTGGQGKARGALVEELQYPGRERSLRSRKRHARVGRWSPGKPPLRDTLPSSAYDESGVNYTARQLVSLPPGCRKGNGKTSR